MSNVKKESTVSFTERAYGFLGFTRKSSGLQKSKSFDFNNSLEKAHPKLNVKNNDKMEKTAEMEITPDSSSPGNKLILSLSPTNRRAPGLASRVPPSTASSSNQKRPISMILPSRRRESSFDTTTEEEEDFVEEMAERQFVKMEVTRVITTDANREVPGTLLITPKMLMFDPAEMSVADIEGEGNQHHMDLEQTVALPLINIIAMNTHASLDKLLEDKSPLSRKADHVFGQLGDTSRLPAAFSKPKPSAAGTPSPSSSDIPSSPPTSTSVAKETAVTASVDNVVGGTENSSAAPAEESKLSANEDSLVTPSFPSDEAHQPEPLSLYLCLRGVPADANTPTASYNPSEIFVFLIPVDRIDAVYAFLSEFAMDMQTATAAALVHSPTVAVAGAVGFTDNYHHGNSHLTDNNSASSPPKDNSLVADALKELEEEHFLPQLRGGTSDILTEDVMIDELASCFPVHLTGTNLTLLFQTSRDGFNLNTIYRRLKEESNCVVLLIRDITNTCFGALMSEKMHSSQYFYGKGESLVFSWKNGFKKYSWTNKNNFFMKGDSTCFSIGAKSGHNAIWFDDNLKHGRSEPTDTFDNPTLCGQLDGSAFIIDSLEVWGFVS